MAAATRRRKAWTIATGILLLLITIPLAPYLRGDAARRAWRDRAVGEVAARYADKAWLDAERAEFAATRPGEGGWVGNELLVMRNGDWIVCRNVCAKEQDTPVRKDLFVGRGSDGTWYYSTFHFCVGKCVLKMERQPDSLTQFVDDYWLRPFNGKSDESLQTTWEHGPWGDDKLVTEGKLRVPS